MTTGCESWVLYVSRCWLRGYARCCAWWIDGLRLLDTLTDVLWLGYDPDYASSGASFGAANSIDNFGEGRRREMRVARPASSPVRVAQPVGPPTSPTHSSEPLLCVVCYDAPRCRLFQPCMHVCTCSACALRVDACPICKGEIAARWKVFIS